MKHALFGFVLVHYTFAQGWHQYGYSNSAAGYPYPENCCTRLFELASAAAPVPATSNWNQGLQYSNLYSSLLPSRQALQYSNEYPNMISSNMLPANMLSSNMLVPNMMSTTGLMNPNLVNPNLISSTRMMNANLLNPNMISGMSGSPDLNAQMSGSSHSNPLNANIHTEPAKANDNAAQVLNDKENFQPQGCAYDAVRSRCVDTLNLCKGGCKDFGVSVAPSHDCRCIPQGIMNLLGMSSTSND